MKAMALALFVAMGIVLVNAEPIRQIIPVVQFDDVRDDAGQFSLRYVSGDGTTLTEVGRLVPNDKGDGHVLIKEGSYSFTSPEGQTFNLRYVADKNGFQPVADHIPVAPVA